MPDLPSNEELDKSEEWLRQQSHDGPHFNFVALRAEVERLKYRAPGSKRLRFDREKKAIVEEPSSELERLRDDNARLREVLKHTRVISHLYPKIRDVIAIYDAASPRAESQEVEHA